MDAQQLVGLHQQPRQADPIVVHRCIHLGIHGPDLPDEAVVLAPGAMAMARSHSRMLPRWAGAGGQLRRPVVRRGGWRGRRPAAASADGGR